MTTHHARRLGAFALTAVLIAAACGSDDDDAAETTVPPADDAAMDDAAMDDAAMDDDGAMMDMDDMQMNMGDPTATPADEVDGAALARGEYVLMDTRPSGYDDVAGTAVIARHTAGTTVTTEISGLLPNVEYISHVHAEPCADDGGPHYQFEVGGPEVPPNEIHLAFTSDNDGNGFMTAENHAIAGLDAVSFVVHPQEFIDNKIACVDFVEDEPGAAAAAIEAGTSHDADSMEMDEMDDGSMDEMDDGSTEMEDGDG